MKAKPTSVVVAMSGGLDSSMAAALLKTTGWEVHGLHFLLPAPALITDARIKAVQMVAEHLQIPFEMIDIREDFERLIIDPFVDAYLQAMTPNPCVRCNALIKFEYLLRYAEENGIHIIATGHYARLGSGDEGSGVELLRGRDGRKDQSYFLHRLNQAHLSRAVFPLGEITKDEAKHQAREMGLPVHSVPESQEICFIPENEYRLFVETRRGPGVNKSGNIISADGEKLGEHAGAFRYTVGQRQGLGIASSRPYYVKEIRPEAREVVVARKEALFSTRVEAVRFHWIGEVPLERPIKAQAQIRYRHRAAPGSLEVISPDEVKFIFDEPQWAVTPGQALVCYCGERVLGGGWIR
ncbi:MAG: tRNA 2-thiouridine(34) synthase MnmA, partial [Deltaproteobacteria bacterium]|nr:tRNA 2-thiouridine(34) synthase MnmA [Deltaproteobacteria bacterium]